MFDGVERLLADAGVIVRTASRAYRPTISGAAMEAEMLKPQNVVEDAGYGHARFGLCRRAIGSGDWCANLVRAVGRRPGSAAVVGGRRPP
jgi:hypothetical protein